MTTLTISGFAQNSHIVERALGISSITLNYLALHPNNLEEHIKNLSIVEEVHAWSLGSIIAINYADIIKPKKLILYAPIYQYLESSNFPHGIKQKDFSIFKDQLIKEQEKLLSHFNLLIAKGSRNLRKDALFLKQHNRNLQTKYLNEWLDFLITKKADLNKIANIKTTIYHSKMDEVVSYKQSEYIKSKLPHIDLHILEHGSHAIFLSMN